MRVEEKISLIEACMDLEAGTLSLQSRMSDYETWDSLTALSIIVMVSEKLNQTITGDELKKAVTVSDIVKLIHG